MYAWTCEQWGHDYKCTIGNCDCSCHEHYKAVERAVDALLAICPDHIRDGKAYVDPDCGACGSRQDAVGIYLHGEIEDTATMLLGGLE